MFLDLKAHDLQIWTGTSHQSPPSAAYWTGSSGGITQRCPSPTAACSLPASTPWTPCLTLPPSGGTWLPHFTYRNRNMEEELSRGLPCCCLPWCQTWDLSATVGFSLSSLKRSTEEWTRGISDGLRRDFFGANLTFTLRIVGL